MTNENIAKNAVRFWQYFSIREEWIYNEKVYKNFNANMHSWNLYVWMQSA